MKPVRILLSAINGYGYYYLKTLIDEVPESEARIAGVIDPDAARSGHYQWIQKKEIPVFDRIEDFFTAGYEADLTIISSPIQYHVPQSICALVNGSHVLVDKPAGSTTSSVKELIAISEKHQRWVEVGFQWSFSDGIQALKKDILNRKYGIPMRFKSICLWPRDYDYFNRNDWAGKLKDPAGHLVLDSIANNACAHFLHNLFFLAGDQMNTCARPQSTEAYLHRVYDIESFDTISMKIITDNDVELFFNASHATEKERHPEFHLEFSEGNVHYGGPGTKVIGTMKNGEIKEYNAPDETHQFQKMFRAIKAVNQPMEVVCPPEAALSQTMCINEIFESQVPVYTFDPEQIVTDEHRKYVKGLYEVMSSSYDNNPKPETRNP